MKVPPEQLSVQFGSYPDEGRGNPTARSSGDKGRPWADRAKLRAATRSESRAGSESTVVTPTRHHRGEGRRIAGKATDARTRNGHRGIGSGTQGRLSEATREARNDGGLRPATLSVGPRSERASERPIVLAKPGNAGGREGASLQGASEEDEGEEIGSMSLTTPAPIRNLQRKLYMAAKAERRRVSTQTMWRRFSAPVIYEQYGVYQLRRRQRMPTPCAVR